MQDPLVIVEGFDPGNNRWWPEIYDAMNQVKMAEVLRSMGYDIVILNFGDGVDYVENNSMLLVEVINQVNAELTAAGSDAELVVFGPSMGSLIVRYALAYMETNSISHNTRVMMEFDGPNQGANLPNGYRTFTLC